MGDVLPLVAIRDLNRAPIDMGEMRAVGARRFAECLAAVIQRHAAEMTPNERREADEALRGLTTALDEVERAVRVSRADETAET